MIIVYDQSYCVGTPIRPNYIHATTFPYSIVMLAYAVYMTLENVAKRRSHALLSLDHIHQNVKNDNPTGKW